MVRQRGYAICTQPRSGSNLLCQLLSSTDQLGRPLEYFNGPGRRALGLPDYPDAPELQIEAVLRLGTTPNGVYAVKLFASQFAAFGRRLRWMDRLPNLHFVYLTRDDLLGQAISWARALQTEQYRSTQPAKRLAVYNAHLIRSQLTAIARERAQWETFFARTGIEPLRIVYERLLEDRSSYVDRLADLVGIENPVVDQRKVDLVIQRDALTEQWKQRFRAENGDSNVLDDLSSNLPSFVRKVRSGLGL
ncbi:MAG: trehalose 2-sulfotransferase [Bradyrhizobium sp.]|jgi:LPS sulfotransferase NodH|nr:trehalose 2-sulfotransferase [Bradyrhizobium sp.]